VTFRDIALERFEKLHPPHANPGADGEPFLSAAYQRVEGGSVDVQCKCGYRAHFGTSELGRTARAVTPDGGPPPFQSLRKEYRGPGRSSK
jgi:hypothetical protein